ncbi:MAG TPA: LysM peptidoglycan-binding domain-containing protein [Opitutaceae bacterium]|jgi:LysM repeat protein|nr:LysM peptidoglycan-binding domain-containing protein [Opitutaceae bacterium]
MDTISRENNTNYLPIAGVLVGVIALAVACFALVKASAASKALAADSDEIAKIDTIESTANSAEQSAQSANANITKLDSSLSDNFNQITTKFGSIDASIAKLQESAKPAPRVKASKSAPAGEGSAPGTVSSDGTYTVKSGDSLAKIARANGVSLADLEAANPGVDPKRLKVGQKINLPTKSQ